MTYFENESALKNLSLILKQATKYTWIYLSNMGKTACEDKKNAFFFKILVFLSQRSSNPGIEDI